MSVSLDDVRKYEDAKERLRHWQGEIFRYITGIAILAAALLVVATFNSQLIPINWITRLLISILLLIVPASFWCGWWELNRVTKYSQDHLFEVVETAYPDHPAVKKLKNDLGEKSPLRIIQFILAILLTLIIIAFVVLIWHSGPSSYPGSFHHHWHNF